jgi:calcineurin-like phosphoesterase family protein
VPNIFLISDTHFGHAGVLQFKQLDGSPMRSFSCVEEMDEHMVERWNSVVRPADKVYHCGDVSMRQQDIATVGRCKGHKRLILGNHDKYQTKLYMRFFEQLYGSRRLDTLLLTHIPVHVESAGGRIVANVHGHVHNNVSAIHFGPKYYNVSVEMLDDYTPISLEDLKLRIKARQEGYEECQTPS